MEGLLLTHYIQVAMERAEYSTLNNGLVYGEIPGIQGVWADGSTREEVRKELQDVLEGWIALRLDRHLPIPEIDGASIRVTQSA